MDHSRRQYLRTNDGLLLAVAPGDPPGSANRGRCRFATRRSRRRRGSVLGSGFRARDRAQVTTRRSSWRTIGAARSTSTSMRSTATAGNPLGTDHTLGSEDLAAQSPIAGLAIDGSAPVLRSGRGRSRHFRMPPTSSTVGRSAPRSDGWWPSFTRDEFPDRGTSAL
jgi:hypothetical protein